MLGYMSLADYYRSIFALAQHHKYQIDSVESIIPYERDLYFSMLIDFIEESKKKTR